MKADSFLMEYFSVFSMKHESWVLKGPQKVIVHSHWEAYMIVLGSVLPPLPLFQRANTVEINSEVVLNTTVIGEASL